MSTPARGRLLDRSTAPTSGERIEELVQLGGATIEQILSGVIDGPLDYEQDHDEWVVLLAGSAELEVGGELFSLEEGDWLVLPRRTPHRLVTAAPGSNWLAVHLPRPQQHA